MPEDSIPQIKVADTPKTEGFVAPATPATVPAKVGAAVAVLILISALAVFIPGFLVYQKGVALAESIKKLEAAGKSQDLQAIKSELKNTKNSLSSFKSSFRLLGWGGFIPFMGSYVRDVGHAIKASDAGLDMADIVLTTAEPYADILGFKGGEKTEAGDGAKTTQERIDFVIKTIPDLVPKMDQIGSKMAFVKFEADQINPDRYPVKFKGKEIRAKIKMGINLIDQATTLVTQGKPLLEEAPYLLGIDSPRTYLVLFQNDKELRPTGGFMTAYAIVKVNKGKFEPVSSSDIYDLDAKYRPVIPAPEPIIKYIKGPYLVSKNLRLRDMNFSPDFAESMKQFSSEAQKVRIKEVDGIIAVDTQLLVNLLDVLGQIGVPGYGNFSTKTEPKCNCPNVIYELESFASIEGPIVWDPAGTGKIIYAPPNYNVRKKIIGPLMNSILANAMGQPKDKLPALFEAAFKSMMEKHVLLYLNNEKAQKAVDAFGLAGTVKPQEGDYLQVNDANLGGRKSNLYVTQEVEQQISVGKDGSVEKTVTVTYKNPQNYDGWLNSVLPNWVRIYVPKGSQLVSIDGLSDKTEPYEELGKTVFAGFFELRPQGVAKVTVKYKLPFKAKGELKLLVQKQPGKDAPLYRIKIGRNEEEEFLRTDKEFRLRI